MNRRYAIGTCCLLFSARALCADEPVTVADFAVQGVLSRIQVYADICTAKVPSLGPDFQALMRGLNARVHEIAKPMLLSYASDPIMHRPTPTALIDAYTEWNTKLRHELDGVDAKKQCPTYLTNYRNASDDFFRAGLEHTFAQVRSSLEESGRKR